MHKKILAAVAALAIGTGSVVSTTATAEAHTVLAYNPTYCVLFLPFLCLPSPPVPHKHHKAAPKHVAAKPKMKMKKM